MLRVFKDIDLAMLQKQDQEEGKTSRKRRRRAEWELKKLVK